MRRSIMRWAVTALVALAPSLAWANDQETAQQIARDLRGSGQLVDYSIGVKYDNGTAVLMGRVANENQMQKAMALTQQMPVVKRVVNQLEIQSTQPQAAAPVAKPQANAIRPQPQVAAPAPAQPSSNSAGSTFTNGLKNLFSGKSLSRSDAQPAANHTPAMSNPSRVELAAGRSDDLPPNPGDPLAVANQARFVPPAQPPRGEKAAAVRMSQMQQTEPTAVMQPTPVDLQESSLRLTGYTTDASAKAAGVRAPTKAKPASAARPISASTLGTRTGQAAASGTPTMQVSNNRVAGLPAGAGGASYASYGGSVYDQPQMPSHAWPSYAAYPNYAGVTYPKQYSPTAYPYIGPFYPYPQVPLGWRRVTLEWDDGWWFLDFENRRERGRRWHPH